MSGDVRAWLSQRSPQPVFDLAPWLDTARTGDHCAFGLTRLGCQALDRALSVPGRVRASALHLLAADALITFACEAALEADDPEQQLERILREVGTR
jgi:hypothetical protein